MRVVTGRQMAELDRRTIQSGVPGQLLMERAGQAVVSELCHRLRRLRHRRFVVLCGKGNNGGDGFVIGRLLTQRGLNCLTVLTCPPDNLGGDAAVHWSRLTSCGAATITVVSPVELDAISTELTPGDVIIDALLGTGLRGPVQGLAAALIDWINHQDVLRFAVDIPSGVHADTGAVDGPAVMADVTVTMGLPKIGHLISPGICHTGRLVVADIGIPQRWAEALPDAPDYCDAAAARALLPRRPVNAHKGLAGHLFIVAGSLGMSGAAALAANAAVAAGAGLVTLATPASIQPVIAAKTTEAMTMRLDDGGFGYVTLSALDALLAACASCEAVAMGPGLGRDAETARVVAALAGKTDVPLVLDADGLFALTDHHDDVRARRAPTVVTPHAGELARLMKTTVEEIERDRAASARAAAAALNAVVVLKGAGTIVAAPDGRISYNSTGNPGMASGGMGDVLTGIIGALLAQGLEAFDAARLGVYLHGAAADILAGPLRWHPLRAGQLIETVGPAWKRLAMHDTTAERAVAVPSHFRMRRR